MAITYHSGERIQGLELNRVGLTGNQGYAGGAGVDNASGAGGGGGGAGAVGVDGTGNTGGNGGAGLANPIVGSSAGASGYFAGGGGGAGGSGNGSGGLGGGGAGNWSGTATAGTTSTGSGGGSGGEGAGNTAGNGGGSGIVILKFLSSGTSYSTTGSPAVDTSTTNYTILTYTSTSASSFTISSGTPDVQYLVVAGGGGGAAGGGGAGGAGGYRTSTLSLSSSTGSSGVHTVTVGAGGTGGSSGNDSGIQGNDSVFDTITSTGGGLGRGYSGAASDSNGGSGGGAGKDSLTDKGGGSPATYFITPVTIPTNVPTYSRFEETDTRKMYSYLSTLKVDEDFSTDNSYDTQTGTAYTVDYTTDDRIEFDFTKDGSTHEVSFDLESMGGFTMDSSSWVAEWTFKVLDSFAQASTSGAHATMAISSVADGGNNQTGDHVALEIRNVVSAGSLMNLVGGVNTGMDNARTTGSVDVGTNGFERFIRLIKNGNTCTLEIYTDSNRNTTPTTHTITLAHTVAMKYFRVLNFTGASGGSNAAGNMSVDNFKFYNGVTDASITALWKELGT